MGAKIDMNPDSASNAGFTCTYHDTSDKDQYVYARADIYCNFCMSQGSIKLRFPTSANEVLKLGSQLFLADFGATTVCQTEQVLSMPSPFKPWACSHLWFFNGYLCSEGPPAKND